MASVIHSSKKNDPHDAIRDRLDRGSAAQAPAQQEEVRTDAAPEQSPPGASETSLAVFAKIGLFLAIPTAVILAVKLFFIP